MLTRAAQDRPDATAYTQLERGDQPGNVLTYRQLEQQTRKLAGYLQGCVQPRERVLLAFRNEHQFIVSFFACLYADVLAVPVPAPTNHKRASQLFRVIEKADPKLILARQDTLSLIQDTVNARFPGRFPNWPDVGEILTGAPNAWQEQRPAPESTALLQFTSGSTGNPKGVMVSHSNLIHNCGLLKQALGATADSRLVSWLPFFHDWGLIGCIIFPLYMQMPAAFLDPLTFVYRPHWWLQAIDAFRATISCSPNFGYETCVERVRPEECEGIDLSTWEVAMIGAEPIQKSTIEGFSSRFASIGFRENAFYPTYGLAESTLIVSGNKRPSTPVFINARRSALEKGQLVECDDSDPIDRRVLVGCGCPIEQQHVRIVDPDTCQLRDEGTPGEVWISGTSVMDGYWQDPNSTSEVLVAARIDETERKYLRTGDIGFILDEQLFICGRLKDMIIKGGNNYYAEDIEQTVQRSHSSLRVGRGVAFSVEAAGLERLVVVHEAGYGMVPEIDELVGAVQKAISGDHQILADAISLIAPGSLMKTSSGKVRRRLMRSKFMEKELEIVASWQNW